MLLWALLTALRVLGRKGLELGDCGGSEDVSQEVLQGERR